MSLPVWHPRSVRGSAFWWMLGLSAPMAMIVLGLPTWAWAPVLGLMLAGRWFQRCPKCKDTAYAGPGSLLRLWPAHTCRMCGYDYAQREERH